MHGMAQFSWHFGMPSWKCRSRNLQMREIQVSWDCWMEKMIQKSLFLYLEGFVPNSPQVFPMWWKWRMSEGILEISSRVMEWFGQTLKIIQFQPPSPCKKQLWPKFWGSASFCYLGVVPLPLTKESYPDFPARLCSVLGRRNCWKFRNKNSLLRLWATNLGWNVALVVPIEFFFGFSLPEKDLHQILKGFVCVSIVCAVISTPKKSSARASEFNSVAVSDWFILVIPSWC